MAKGSGAERESALGSGWTVEGRAQPEAGETVSPVRDARGPEHGDADAAQALADTVETSHTAEASHTAETSDTELAPAEGAQPAQPAPPAQPAQLSNLSVVLLGLTGGLYLLYGWVWLSWAQYYAEVNALTALGSGEIGGVLQRIVYWIAPLAPVLWYLAAIVLLRGRSRALAVALIAGLIMLLPLPMIFSRGAAL